MFIRRDYIILLYNECLEEEPIYIPRKLRSDSTFTMSEQERNIYLKLNLTTLKREMEVLTMIRKYFRKKLNKMDHEFTAFIVTESVSQFVRKKLVEEWTNRTPKTM